MDLNKTVELGQLLDAYGEMLTDKKKEILSMYVNDNMSYQEIGTYFNISKPAVLDSIRVAVAKLNEYESKLKLVEYKHKLLEISNLDESKIKQELISFIKEL